MIKIFYRIFVYYLTFNLTIEYSIDLYSSFYFYQMTKIHLPIPRNSELEIFVYLYHPSVHIEI